MSFLLFGDIEYISPDLEALFKKHDIRDWSTFLRCPTLSIVSNLESTTLLSAYIQAILRSMSGQYGFKEFFTILHLQSTQIWYYRDQDATYGIYVDEDGSLTGENALGDALTHLSLEIAYPSA